MIQSRMAFSINSLRVKTVLWASIPVVLVMAAILTITPMFLEEMAQTVAQQRDVELARISASRLSEELAGQARRLLTLAADNRLQSMQPDGISTALSGQVERLTQFDVGIVVYDVHGQALWSYPESIDRKGALFPVSSKFDEVQQTLRAAYSDIFKDSATGREAVLIAVPIVNQEGDFTGVLAGIATLRFSRMGEMYAKLLEFKEGRRGFAYLVDGKGRVIYHRHAKHVGKDMTAIPPVKMVVMGSTGSMLTRDSTGEPIIVGFAPVPGTDWGLITQETWDIIIKPIRHDRALLLALLVVAGVLANVVIFLAVSRVLKPIHNLTTGASRIAQGDFDYRISANTGDEVQTLSEQFNTMAEALKKSYSDLEQRVRERTTDLAIAKERAEAADRLKTDFLATMSHELRTPLNSIIGFTGIIMQGMSGPVNAEQEKQLNMVYKSAKHLLELINDILDLSKIEAGKVTLVREKFSMRELIDKVAETASPMAAEKGLALHIDFAPKKANIHSDKRRVEQVLLNLVNNAIKFTAEGVVTISGRIVDNRLEVSVEDTGIGVEKDQIEVLFETFRQVELTRSRKHEGTGLGLAICKKIVALLNGDIWAESRYGKGSTFTFSLPVDKPGT